MILAVRNCAATDRSKGRPRPYRFTGGRPPVPSVKFVQCHTFAYLITLRIALHPFNELTLTPNQLRRNSLHRHKPTLQAHSNNHQHLPSPKHRQYPLRQRLGERPIRLQTLPLDDQLLLSILRRRQQRCLQAVPGSHLSARELLGRPRWKPRPLWTILDCDDRSGYFVSYWVDKQVVETQWGFLLWI